MKLSRVVFGATLAVAAAAMPASAQITVSGSTKGCFYQGSIGSQCSSGAASATAGNLTFTGKSFSANVDQSGFNFIPGTSTNSLGLFSMNSNDFNFNPPGNNNTYGFKLFVTITAPSTTPAGVDLIGVLSGTLDIDTSNDKLDILFSDNFTTFTYAGGSFDFRAYDIIDLNKSESLYLGYKIDCGVGEEWDSKSKKMVQTPGTCGASVPSPFVTAPEPSTYALMTAGLLGIFGAARRRRQA